MLFNFSTGDTIELDIMIGEETTKCKTLIERVENDELFLIHAPIRSGHVLLIHPGENVDVFFPKYDVANNRYEIYNFDSRVKSREIIDGISMWWIERKSEIVKVQRRDYFRLNYVKKMLVQRPNSEKTINILTRDISAGGIRFISSAKLKEGEEIICHIALEKNPVVLLKGHVIGVEISSDSATKQEVRVEFYDVSKEVKRDIIQQINLIQSVYLKKLAHSQYQEHMEEIMAPINIEKLERYNGDVNFDNKLGYLKGISVLGLIIMVALFFISRPRSIYPVSKFFNIIYREGWNLTTLYAGVGVGIAVSFFSFLGIYIDQTHYFDRKKSNVTFLVCALVAIILMAIHIRAIVMIF